ncbi:MAG TPA: GxxExxY protein [Gemmatimonadaceae bacterium]|nr:GxxExxY protein [Gemmatimonadaceae bacterium]
MPNKLESAAPNPHGRRLVEKELSYRIVGCFMRVHNQLRFGFVESVYAKAMCVALHRVGLRVQREVPVVVRFDGVEVGHHRLDMLVEGRIILELKSTEKISEVPKRQIRSYLAAANLELGLLLHFGPEAKCYRVLHQANNGSPRFDSGDSGDSDA